MMTYQDALDYLYSFTDYGNLRTYKYSPQTFDLSRMRDLMARLGNPQDRYPILHVAGTKGKGSTSAMCACVLYHAGYRTGFYTSPHLQDFCERIQINGHPIPRDDVAQVIDEIRCIADRIPGLTTFELNTAMAFVYFARQKVDAAVVEVGLGGRLDATNVVTPLASAITSLSYDHMHLLGNTLAKIAAEKAGIIKPGVPVVSAPQQLEALAVLERVAAERNAPLTLVGRDVLYEPESHTLRSQVFHIRRVRTGEGDGHERRFEIHLLGAHQVQNAATAYAALDALRQRGLTILENAVREGFRNVCWPGRFEILGEAPYLIADCAHNGDSAEKLVAALDDYFPGRSAILIFGASADKDWPAMFRALMPRVRHAILTQAVHPRAIESDEMAEAATRYGVPAEAVAPVSEAFERALALARPDEVIVATGSIFVVAEVREAWYAPREAAKLETADLHE